MAFGDPGEALRAKAELARRHAEEQRREAHEQLTRARDQREAELRAVEAAQSHVRVEGPYLRCVRCNALWRSDAVKAATRRHECCLLCGGPLTPVDS